MSFSYSGLTNYGKSTLPSVECGFGSMNILKDPPKSIHTTRKIKVGDTNFITNTIEKNKDRFSESISFYARGINPSISVDYGTNGGSNFKSGSENGISGMNNGHAYLPYRIMRDGEFRPPEVKPYDLLPLSRMPRLHTKSDTNKCFIDYSKKIESVKEDYRAVKKNIINTSVKPTATYNLSTSINEPYDVKYTIKDPINVSAVSGMRFIDKTILDVKKPTKEINDDIIYNNVNSNIGSRETVRDLDNTNVDTDRYLQETLNSNVSTNISDINYIENTNVDTDRYLQETLNSNVSTNISDIKYVDNTNVDTDRYLQDVLSSEVNSKKSQSIMVTPIDQLHDINVKTKDNFNISHTPTLSGYTKDDYIHNDIELDRRVLLTNANSGKQQNIYVRPDIEYQREYKRNIPNTEMYTNKGTKDKGTEFITREYKLRPSIDYGYFEGKANKPMINNYINNHIDGDLGKDKSDNNKKIMSMNQDRYR